MLLLNTVLTVRAHPANSHRGIGWEEFTDAAIRVLNGQDRPMVFILWGRPAQLKKAMLKQSEAPDFRGASSEPAVGVPGIFRKQAVQQDQRVSGVERIGPIDWQIENI